MIDNSVEQPEAAAINAPLEACVAITGPSGTGKSRTLRLRAERAERESPEAVVMLSHPRHLKTLAVEILASAGVATTLIDDVDAESAFEYAAQTLFSLDWDEFAAGHLDPEVPGLRSPERFLVSAFRLIRKLRAAAIEPAEFLERSLAGAARFYAKPPNFAHPDLIHGTKDAYRDSLNVESGELERQYRREIDLAKILARLYEAYNAILARAGTLTGRDAVARAVSLLKRRAELAAAFRERVRTAFIDEAQDLTLGQIALLEALFGANLSGVTLAGDPGSATNTFRGARPDRAFSAATIRVELREQRRSPLAVELASRRMCADGDRMNAVGVPAAIVLHRAKTEADEAAFVAASVRAELDAGVPPEDIALVFRSVSDVHLYERALIERDIPVTIAGDTNIFTDARALDALALLWNVWDPFHHEWMLRTLGGHALALSDASIGKLCGEPPDKQTALFAFDGENAPTTRSGRWDPKRDLRLGWNVIRGEQDGSLSETARERICRFRALRESWLEAMHTRSFADFAQLVWSQGLAAEGPEGSARLRTQQAVLARLSARLEHYAALHPASSLGDVLEYAEKRAQSDLEACEDSLAPGFVRLLSVDAAQGREFETVIIPDARAGSFPRWYVPDSFLYSPTLGMVSKENVGEARAARTAKFSYYVYRAKARENYNHEERRAFVYAMRRAKKRLVVTASGRATRGTTAPEFLEELRNARLPGTRIEE